MKTLKAVPRGTHLWIFDLDGTLALIEHRRHLVENKPPRWREFYERCVGDKPNAAVCAVFRVLFASGHDVLIWSARDEVVRPQTLAWLEQNVMPGYDFDSILTMRLKGTSTPDDVLKKSWLDAMTPLDRARLSGIFDDRDKVVKMWRDQGITCLQVAPGNF